MEENTLFNVVREITASLQESAEYQAGCQHCSLACKKLEIIAQRLYARKEELQTHCSCDTVRKEYASGSMLHRGYYCPSPTQDIIVGNVKRGKLLKRLTCVSKPSYEYGFDTDGKLLYCKWLNNGKPTYIEYLVYEDHSIFGITLYRNGEIAYLTEERILNGRLTDYSFGIFSSGDSTFRCNVMEQEHYEYDAQGLCSCDMHQYVQASATSPAIYCHSGKYAFQRKNGLLTSYTDQHGREYQVRIRRKA